MRHQRNPLHCAKCWTLCRILSVNICSGLSHSNNDQRADDEQPIPRSIDLLFPSSTARSRAASVCIPLAASCRRCRCYCTYPRAVPCVSCFSSTRGGTTKRTGFLLDDTNHFDLLKLPRASRKQRSPAT